MLPKSAPPSPVTYEAEETRPPQAALEGQHGGVEGTSVGLVVEVLTFVDEWVYLSVCGESCHCCLQLLQARGREGRFTEQVVDDRENHAKLC